MSTCPRPPGQPSPLRLGRLPGHEAEACTGPAGTGPPWAGIPSCASICSFRQAGEREQFIFLGTISWSFRGIRFNKRSGSSHSGG